VEDSAEKTFSFLLAQCTKRITLVASRINCSYVEILAKYLLKHWLISGFRREVAENCALLGYSAACSPPPLLLLILLLLLLLLAAL